MKIQIKNGTIVRNNTFPDEIPKGMVKVLSVKNIKIKFNQK